MTHRVTIDLSRRAALAGSAAALASWAGGAPAAHASTRDRLVAAQSADVLTLDPSMDTSPVSLNLFRNIYDQLTDIAADGSVRPLLATSWAPSADATVWTFAIRTDAKFHDGTKLTLDDVIWSFTKIMEDSKSPVRAYLNAVAKIEPHGADQVTFTLKAPFAPFDRQVSLISIVPRAAYTRLGADAFALQPVGSGPYKLVRWIKDDRIELEANKDYWGGSPAIDHVALRPVPSDASRATGLQSGELDLVPALPPALVTRLERLQDVRIVRVVINRVVYLGFDVANQPLGDLKLRQAIDCAIDRTAICTKLLRGMGKPEGQLAAPVTFGYDPAIQPTGFDPAKARDLVKASGYKGERLLFQYPNNRTAFANEVAQAVAGYLEAADIGVELQGMEYSAFFPLWLGRGLHGIHMFAFGPSIMDADLPLSSLYETGSRGYWIDPETDRMIKAQRAQSDPAERKRIIAQIWRRSQEFVPYAALYDEGSAYGIRRDLEWEPRPDERLVFANARFQEGSK